MVQSIARVRFRVALSLTSMMLATVLLSSVAQAAVVALPASTAACRQETSSCWLTRKVGQPQALLQPNTSFHLINDRADTVKVAFGWYMRSADAQLISEVGIPVVMPDMWVAEGWFNLKPQMTQAFHVPGTRREIYIFMEANGVAIEPTEYGDVAEFCIVPQAFSSRNQVADASFEIEYDARRTISGTSCTEVGGESRTFYQVAHSGSITLE